MPWSSGHIARSVGGTLKRTVGGAMIALAGGGISESANAMLAELIGGLRASMGYLGCQTIDEVRSRAEFVEISSAGIRESHVHDVQIVKEAPNYHTD